MGSFGRLWSVVVLTGIVATLASIIILGGVIPEIAFFVAIPVVVVEEKGTLDSLKRSFQFTRQRWIFVIELLLVVGLILVVPSLVVSYATSYALASGGLTQVVAFAIYDGLASPLFIGVSVVFYYSGLARFSVPSQPSVPQARADPRLWVCKNCGAATVSTVQPNDTMFGGCPKGSKVTFTVPKHNWNETGPAPRMN